MITTSTDVGESLDADTWQAQVKAKAAAAALEELKVSKAILADQASR